MKINTVLFVGLFSLVTFGASFVLALPGLSDPAALLHASAAAEKNTILPDADVAQASDSSSSKASSTGFDPAVQNGIASPVEISSGGFPMFQVGSDGMSHMNVQFGVPGSPSIGAYGIRMPNIATPAEDIISSQADAINQQAQTINELQDQLSNLMTVAGRGRHGRDANKGGDQNRDVPFHGRWNGHGRGDREQGVPVGMPAPHWMGGGGGFGEGHGRGLMRGDPNWHSQQGGRFGDNDCCSDDDNRGHHGFSVDALPAEYAHGDEGMLPQPFSGDGLMIDVVKKHHMRRLSVNDDEKDAQDVPKKDSSVEGVSVKDGVADATAKSTSSAPALSVLPVTKAPDLQSGGDNELHSVTDAVGDSGE